MLTRRGFTALAALAPRAFLEATERNFRALPAALQQLERTNGGRLGVFVVDVGTGERSGYREHGRFPMCSTFKFLLASAVLQRVDRAQETLDRSLAIPPKPLLFHSPLTEPHAGATMTVSELCHAVMTQSDNTAANVLLETVGGPVGVTMFARSIGDRITRLDRKELALNESKAGDPRDTTSPAAMAGDLKAVLLGNVLTPESRQRLTAWMEANVTGLDRLREKLPAGWRAADKTGSNGEHTSNDIAVFWPAANKPPVIVAAYITQCAGAEEKRAAMLSDIGTLVIRRG